MKRESIIRRKTHLLSLSVAGAAMVIIRPALGATVSWTGLSQTLGTASDWTGGNLPGSGDEAYFGALKGSPPSNLGFKGTGTTPPTISLTWGSVVFDDSAINSSGPLNIDSSLSTTNTGAASLTLDGDGVATDDIIQLTNNVTGLVDFRGNGATSGSPLTLTLSAGQVDVVNSAATLEIEAILASSSDIIKVGSGTLYLYNNANPVFSTFTDGVTVNAGILAFNNGDALGNATNPITTTINDATLEYLPKTADSTASLVANRTFALTNAASIIDVTPGNTMVINGSIIGNGALNKTDAGILQIVGAGTYLGGTNVTDGTLQIGSTGSISSSTVSISSGATMTVNGSINTATALTDNGTFNSTIPTTEIGTLNGTGAVNLNSSTLQVDGGGTFSGAIGQSGTGGSVVMTGIVAGSTLALSGTNTYSGGTTISGGTVQTANNSALGTGPVAVSAPGILDLDGQTPTIGNLSGSGTVDNVSAGGTATLAINTSTSSNFSGVIKNTTGSTAIVVSGTGTEALSGINTYTGGTTVNSGTLLIEPTSPTTGALPTGALSISGSGIVQLADNVTAGTPLASSNVNLTSLSITGNGTLDIGNNRIIIDYSSPATDPIASIEQWINNGFYGLPGASIISSDITADDAASGLSYGIGYADGADGVVAGLPSGEIEIMFTLLGDANMDGTVNSEDFSPFSHNLGQGGMMWDDGDFNYDGTVNSEDFSPFSHNLGQTASLAAAAGVLEEANRISFAGVPEPASMGLLTLGIVGVLARRRRI